MGDLAFSFANLVVAEHLSGVIKLNASDQGRLEHLRRLLERRDKT